MLIMRKLIENELKKVQYVDLSDIEEGKDFIIKKRIPDTFEVNKEYIIELSDDLLVKGKNPILESNFNRGKVPLDKKLHGEVEKLFGKMIVFVGYGWDNSDNDNYWNGYLPKDKIKILKLL